MDWHPKYKGSGASTEFSAENDPWSTPSNCKNDYISLLSQCLDITFLYILYVSSHHFYDFTYHITKFSMYKLYDNVIRESGISADYVCKLSIHALQENENLSIPFSILPVIFCFMHRKYMYNSTCSQYLQGLILRYYISEGQATEILQCYIFY